MMNPARFLDGTNRRTLGQDSQPSRRRVSAKILMVFFLLPSIAFLSRSAESDAQSSVESHVPKEIRRLTVDGYLNAVAWSADGTRLATLGEFGSKISLFDTKTWSLLHKFERYSGAYSNNSLEFLPDNTLVTAAPIGSSRKANLSSSDPRYDHLDMFSLINWQPEAGQVIRYFPDVGYPPKEALPTVGKTDTYTISRDGALIAGIHWSNVLIYDARSGSLVTELATPRIPTHPDRAVSLAFSPDGKELAVGTGSGVVNFYDTKTWVMTHSFTAYDDEEEYSCNALAYSPDGIFLAVGKYQRLNLKKPNSIAVNIFRASTGDTIAALEGTPIPPGGPSAANVDPVRTLSWSSNGLLAVGDDASLRLWRIGEATQTLLLNVRMSHGTFKTAFSPQGILAATDNNQVVIYQ